MKRVLLIADSNMSLSGVPVVFMSIVRQLKNKYTFDIIVLKDNDMYFEKEFKSYGGNVYRFNFNKPQGMFSKFLWLVNKYPKSVRTFIKENIDLPKYDVMHSFNEGFSYPFLKAAKSVGVNKRILHICSAKSAYPKKKSFSQSIFDWYQKKAMKCCTNIAFVSQKSLELNNYKNRGVVVYNIYDEQKFGQITECIHNNLELTQIGTFSDRKNQLFSLEVVNRIKKKIPNVHLNIVGKEMDEGYLEKMNLYIKNHNLQTSVSILGTSTDRIKLNRNTSYVLYPSTMESFGLILIESQSSGIHCFANIDMPKDANMGNTDFLKLDSTLWANSIIEYFVKNGNERKKPINKDKFSVNQFINTLNNLYS